MKWFTHPKRYVDWFANAVLSALLVWGALLAEVRMMWPLAGALLGTHVAALYRLTKKKEDLRNE